MLIVSSEEKEDKRKRWSSLEAIKLKYQLQSAQHKLDLKIPKLPSPNLIVVSTHTPIGFFEQHERT
jgi:hypothetical protein